MTDLISPPEGQLSFSGIPSAEFIEDVDSHMASEESAESQLKVLMIKNNGIFDPKKWQNYYSIVQQLLSYT